MSHITGSFIQWGFDPRITSSALFETTYLFLRVACHSLWPISHLHTIPLKRYVFLYAFMSSASISLPHLFLHSLNEVHRSSTIGHALIQGASSGDVPPPPSSIGVDAAEISGAAAADVPPPTSSNDSNIRRTLDHVLTIQAAQGQILVDVLDEIRGLRADLAQFRRSSSPPPFDDGF